MKKHILLPFVLGLGLLLFANSAKSQHFQIVASFGATQNWAVPNAVLYEIDYYYPHHQIVHINRERRGRRLYYNVLLERHNQFVEVFFGRQALILDINYYHSYPLAQHICSGHCGYHRKFYKAHRVSCNHRHHDHHHHAKYNHVAYRSHKNHNTYASKSGAANRNVRTRYASNTSRSSNSRNTAVRRSNNRSNVNTEAKRSRTSSRVARSNRSSGSARKTTISTRKSNNSRSSAGRSSRSRSSRSSRNR